MFFKTHYGETFFHLTEFLTCYCRWAGEEGVTGKGRGAGGFIRGGGEGEESHHWGATKEPEATYWERCWEKGRKSQNYNPFWKVISKFTPPPPYNMRLLIKNITGSTTETRTPSSIACWSRKREIWARRPDPPPDQISTKGPGWGEAAHGHSEWS